MARRRRRRFRSAEDEMLSKKKRFIKEIILWVLTIVIALTAAWYVSFHLVDKATVIGNSMSPTLEEDDIILISKKSYQISSPKRFDVIVYKQTNGEHRYYDIKRVIGLPGETVKIDDSGSVWIDETLLIEEIMVDPMTNGGLAEDGITLDEDEYFVLGDNRNQSEDSRFANVGNVLASDIIGKALAKMEPFTFIEHINRLPQEDAE